MIQLTRAGVIADPETVDTLRTEFQEKGCTRLPCLLEPELLEHVLGAVARGRWTGYVRKGFDSNCILDPCPAVDFLHFVTNWPRFLQMIHQITGCGPFTWFGGLVYRMEPNAGHYDAWHSDNTDDRRVAMSLNLSPRGYEGGLLQMRQRDSDRLLVDVANTGPGDAIIFRIAENLLHQVTEVVGSEPKTAFAGWFNGTAPTLAERLRSIARPTTLLQ